MLERSSANSSGYIFLAVAFALGWIPWRPGLINRPDAYHSSRYLLSNLNVGQINRAQALSEVAEGADLVRTESNRAFVLMQYVGYLRRNRVNTADVTRRWLLKQLPMAVGGFRKNRTTGFNF